MKDLLEQLSYFQTLVLNTVTATDDTAYAKQFHPSLSPIGWHLGHCIFTENYWLRERLLGVEKTRHKLMCIYEPSLSPKSERNKKTSR